MRECREQFWITEADIIGIGKIHCRIQLIHSWPADGAAIGSRKVQHIAPVAVDIGKGQKVPIAIAFGSAGLYQVKMNGSAFCR